MSYAMNIRGITAVVACLFVLAATARGWWVEGHGYIAAAAATGLPKEMPAFFRAAGPQLAHLAGEPDRWKNPAAKALRAHESPEHFLDTEHLQGRELPRDRYQAIALMAEVQHPADKTGLLPYAIMEGYERLTCAFADLRREPDNPAVRAKCLTYAGWLAHYTGDCAMPLHTTEHYDGRPGPDGQTQQKGIHAKIDGFPEKHGFAPAEIARGLKAQAVDDVWARILREIDESHTHVERCYALDAAAAFDMPTPESRAFILARCRVAAQFTMDLWYTAWLRSATWPPPY